MLHGFAVQEEPQPAWPPRTADGVFATTRWTVIHRAAQQGDSKSAEALTKLCETYWLPVYAFIRRRNHSPEQSKDQTQGFFQYLLDKKPFANADQAKGKFRSYLLTAVKFYLSREREKSQAQKRGGKELHLSIDTKEAEGFLAGSLADTITPEILFDLEWIRVVMKESETDLMREYVRNQKGTLCEQLLPFVVDQGRATTSIPELAIAKGVSEASLRMAASRMRKRYGEILREKIVATVESPDQVDEEVRGLLQVLRECG